MTSIPPPPAHDDPHRSPEGWRHAPPVKTHHGVGTDFAPASTLAALPRLYATERTPLAAKTLHVKWFSPYTGWTWYAAEYDPDDVDGLCFGLVLGHEREWGYFTLRELAGLTRMNGQLPLVERDVHYTPTTEENVR